LIEHGVKHAAGDPEQLLLRAGEILVDFTNCAAVSTTPADENAVIKRIEIVKIGTKMAMIVLLTSTGILKSKACRTDVEITPDLIETFYNITARNFLDKPLLDISTVMIQTLVASLGKKALIMSPLLVTISDLAGAASQSEIILGGQTNLLGYREFEKNAAELLKFLHKSEPLSNIISSTNDDLNILIGNENKYRELENSSMIISRYLIGGREGGSIGIIGPTRMNYAGLIPKIRYLTSLVGKILSEVYEEDAPDDVH
jgi:heat-inducible transcriptional repressor